MVSHKNC